MTDTQTHTDRLIDTCTLRLEIAYTDYYFSFVEVIQALLKVGGVDQGLLEALGQDQLVATVEGQEAGQLLHTVFLDHLSVIGQGHRAVIDQDHDL